MSKKLIYLLIALFYSGSLFATQFVPFSDHVVVQVFKEKTTGGIIIPDVGGKVKTGIVADKGIDAMKINLGDIVIFGKYSGTDIKIEGEEYIVLQEADILGTGN